MHHAPANAERYIGHSMAAANAAVTPWMRDTLREGFNHLNSGRINDASACCKKLLTAKSDLVEGHFLVGLIALEIRQPANAIRAFGSVTRLDPTHGAAWANLANLFLRAGHAGRADAALAKAVEYADDNPVVLDLIGTVHGQLGEQEEAGHWFSRAAQKNPDDLTHQINLANNYRFRDRLEEAEALLSRVLKNAPRHPNAHWLLSGLRKATDRNHVELLEDLVAWTDNPRAQAFLYYGMGKELEDLEEWAAAFDAFSHGASARRQTLDFDEGAESAMFDAFTETFTKEWLTAQSSTVDDASAIFVVGQPRTGTTLVERIIVAHSQVHSAGELRQFGHCTRRLANYREAQPQSARLATLAAAVNPSELGRAYLQTTEKQRGGTPRFVDKLPPNYLYLPLILKALPNAKIVHLRRSPMDACFASFKQLFADAYPHSYDQRETARHHIRYFRLMETWRERFPGRFLDISYEDTAANLEPNARNLIDFLELPWENACLEFHKQNTAVTTASAVQVRQPAHTRSVGRWHRYERQLAPMRAELHAAGVPENL